MKKVYKVGTLNEYHNVIAVDGVLYTISNPKWMSGATSFENFEKIVNSYSWDGEKPKESDFEKTSDDSYELSDEEFFLESTWYRVIPAPWEREDLVLIDAPWSVIKKNIKSERLLAKKYASTDKLGFVTSTCCWSDSFVKDFKFLNK